MFDSRHMVSFDQHDGNKARLKSVSYCRFWLTSTDSV